MVKNFFGCFSCSRWQYSLTMSCLPLGETQLVQVSCNIFCIIIFQYPILQAQALVNLFPGDAVVNVYINHEKKFAFVEMRSVEEASNAMALDGIIFEVLVNFMTIFWVNMLFSHAC